MEILFYIIIFLLYFIYEMRIKKLQISNFIKCSIQSALMKNCPHIVIEFKKIFCSNTKIKFRN